MTPQEAKMLSIAARTLHELAEVAGSGETVSDSQRDTIRRAFLQVNQAATPVKNSRKK